MLYERYDQFYFIANRETMVKVMLFFKLSRKIHNHTVRLIYLSFVLKIIR